jgi:hypothetical protein
MEELGQAMRDMPGKRGHHQWRLLIKAPRTRNQAKHSNPSDGMSFRMLCVEMLANAGSTQSDARALGLCESRSNLFSQAIHGSFTAFSSNAPAPPEKSAVRKQFPTARIVVNWY